MPRPAVQSFLVMEADNLVREDITEALELSFAGCSVTVFEAVESLIQGATEANENAILILSEMVGDLQSPLTHLAHRIARSRIVVIGALPPDCDEVGGPWSVPRPFSNDALIAAVKSALSAPLLPPS